MPRFLYLITSKNAAPKEHLTVVERLNFYQQRGCRLCRRHRKYGQKDQGGDYQWLQGSAGKDKDVY